LKESAVQEQKLIEGFFSNPSIAPKDTAKALLGLNITKTCSIRHLVGRHFDLLKAPPLS
jgi:hypothetical protein